MTDSSHPKNPSSKQLPKRSLKRADGQRSAHDPRTQIEEAMVWLHALVHYNEDSLTQPELDFLHVAKKNLAKMHRRLHRS